MKILSIICIRSYSLWRLSHDCSILQAWQSVVGSTAGGVGIERTPVLSWKVGGGAVSNCFVLLRMTLFIRWYRSCSQRFHWSVSWWWAVRISCWVMSLWSWFLVCVCVGWGVVLRLLALDWLCRRSVCCTSMSLLCRTVIFPGTNCEDVASAGRNYVAIVSTVLVSLLHL